MVAAAFNVATIPLAAKQHVVCAFLAGLVTNATNPFVVMGCYAVMRPVMMGILI